MAYDPLLSTLLDLDSALNSPQKLIIGGGYGLYLKLYLKANSQIRALFPVDKLPIARTTEDIDLFWRASDSCGCSSDRDESLHLPGWNWSPADSRTSALQNRSESGKVWT